MPKTLYPFSAARRARGSPTYPNPTTATFGMLRVEDFFTIEERDRNKEMKQKDRRSVGSFR